jgi:hypothetical protein
VNWHLYKGLFFKLRVFIKVCIKTIFMMIGKRVFYELIAYWCWNYFLYYSLLQWIHLLIKICSWYFYLIMHNRRMVNNVNIWQVLLFFKFNLRLSIHINPSIIRQMQWILWFILHWIMQPIVLNSDWRQCLIVH